MKKLNNYGYCPITRVIDINWPCEGYLFKHCKGELLSDLITEVMNEGL